MKPQRVLLTDLALLLGTAFFFMACLATSHRSPKTLRPGQVSVSGSYLRAEDLDDPDDDAVNLIAAEVRAGVIRGMDLGLAHTWDVSGGCGAYSTVWGDLKLQLTNRDNRIMKPILSTGLIKGYVYKDVAKLHITSLPVMVGIPVKDWITPFALYRHEFIQESFLSNNFEDLRQWFCAGAEFTLAKPAAGKGIPKLGVSIGTFNSIDGSEGGDSGLTLNVGLSIDSPK